MYTNNQFPPQQLQSLSSSSSSSCCNNPFVFGGGKIDGTSNRRRQRGHQQKNHSYGGGYSPNFGLKSIKTKRMKIDTTETEEDMIARELNELTVEERERAYEDLHGVTNTKNDEDKETPEFITLKLQEMNIALDTNRNKFSAKQLRDYYRALFLWPQLKTNVDFKLMFLRADDYDGTKAAKRLVNYYQQKKILFGDDKLVKKITIDDLSEEDIQVLKSGFSFELPQRDTSGRPILYCNTSKFEITSSSSVDSAVRACWYILMAAFTETKEAQRKGVCNIVQSPSTTDFMASSKLAIRCGHNYNSCLPGRITAFHSFYDAPDIGYWVLKYIPLNAGKYSRLRFRGHLGSDIEIEYELLAYGIRLDGLLHTVAQNDDSSKCIFNEYVTRRIEIDKKYTQNELMEATKSGYVPFPHPSDALFGRGRPYREWDGSRLWNCLVDKYATKYKSCETKFDKSLIAYHVLEDYRRSSKSRFLLEPILSSTTKQQQQQQQQQQQKEGGGEKEKEEGSGNGGGWKILDLDSREAKQKAIYALQNRVKALSSSRATGSAGTTAATGN